MKRRSDLDGQGQRFAGTEAIISQSSPDQDGMPSPCWLFLMTCSHACSSQPHADFYFL